MPKCKKCGQNMPKSFSYCGCCGADMATGLVPTPTKIFDTPTKEETTTTPVAETSTTKDISSTVPKVSLTPNQSIDEYLEDAPAQSTESQPVEESKPKVTAPPQQKFVSATDVAKTTPVTQQTKPVAPNTPVTPPPQQKFVSATDVAKTTPVTQQTKPVAHNTPVTPPPQQKFVSATDVAKTTNTTPVAQPTQQTTPVVPKPAYVPKPTPNTQPSDMVVIPNVTNLNQDDARSQLEKIGLKVTIETSDSTVIKPNVVMSQSVTTGTKVTRGSAITIVVSVGTWSDWSVERVLDTNMYVVEQKKEFRSRSRNKEIETHESSERNLPGYTCIDQRRVYSEWEDEGYYTTENRATSETCDVSTNLIGFKYCGYSYVGGGKSINTCYSTKESALVFNPTTTPEDWQYTETVLYQDIPAEVVDWFPTNDTERVTPAGDTINSSIKMTAYSIDGKRYAMKYGSLSTEWFLYHTRTEIETVYTYKREYFTDWSEWSNWSDHAMRQDELNEVEARILYRYRRKTSKDMH